MSADILGSYPECYKSRKEAGRCLVRSPAVAEVLQPYKLRDKVREAIYEEERVGIK